MRSKRGEGEEGGRMMMLRRRRKRKWYKFPLERDPETEGEMRKLR